jgi:hypothetical protein
MVLKLLILVKAISDPSGHLVTRPQNSIWRLTRSGSNILLNTIVVSSLFFEIFFVVINTKDDRKHQVS